MKFVHVADDGALTYPLSREDVGLMFPFVSLPEDMGTGMARYSIYPVEAVQKPEHTPPVEKVVEGVEEYETGKYRQTWAVVAGNYDPVRLRTRAVAAVKSEGFRRITDNVAPAQERIDLIGRALATIVDVMQANGMTANAAQTATIIEIRDQWTAVAPYRAAGKAIIDSLDAMTDAEVAALDVTDPGLWP